MQELRLVAVSEDGSYLVLAADGRGSRFTLPVDDRLRAAVRGNFSRLGQYEIEVESPLRPKEIQARIRSGETAEEIAAVAGIPIDRVRWFEGPVLQEREYIAQQARQISVRLPGDSSAGPRLGEMVAERLAVLGVATDEIDWDARKREDGLWRIDLGFILDGTAHHAEWLFDTRRRHVTPGDDQARRLSTADLDPHFVDQRVDEGGPDVVTPLVPRPKLQPVEPARAVGDDSRPAVSQTTRGSEPATRASEETARVSEQTARVSEETAAKPAEEPRQPAPKATEQPGRPAPESARATEATDEAKRPEQPAGSDAKQKRPAGRKGRGRRSSVPSWDEIMFGAKRDE